MEILNEQVISNSEAKEIMDQRGEDKTMAYEQKICIEYLEMVPHLTKAKAEKMKEELSEIKSLKPAQIAMIMNIFPDTQEELILLFGKDPFDKGDSEKVLEISKKYKPKKE